jgi:hypothetical protein
MKTKLLKEWGVAQAFRKGASQVQVTLGQIFCNLKTWEKNHELQVMSTQFIPALLAGILLFGETGVLGISCYIGSNGTASSVIQESSRFELLVPVTLGG